MPDLTINCGLIIVLIWKLNLNLHHHLSLQLGFILNQPKIISIKVRIVNLEKKRIEEECQRLRDENGVYRERLQEAARVQNSPSASQYMSQEIEALASQVEELTEELINERQRNTTLERSLQGPKTADGMTQTDFKGFI